MKFFVKIMFCLFMVIGGLAIGTCNASAYPSFEDFYYNMSIHGFDINRQFVPRFIYPYEDGTPEIVNETLYRVHNYSASIKDKKLYDITIVDAMIEYLPDTDYKCYIFKVYCKPYQPGRNWGFMGIGSYGDDFSMDHVQVTIDFPKLYFLQETEPKNLYNGNGPLTFTLHDKTPVATVNVDYSHPGFTMLSNAEFGNPYFLNYYKYDYKNYYDYACQETSCYGMANFKYAGAVNFTVDFDVVFHSLYGYETNFTNFHVEAITHYAL